MLLLTGYRTLYGKLSILNGKHPHENISTCSALEAYDKTPIFIPVEMVEGVVKLFMWEILGSSDPGGTNSEALHRWLLKIGDESKRLCNSVGKKIG